MRKLGVFATLVLMSVFAAGAVQAGDALTVHVSALRNDKGQVGCMLFASADGFPKSPEKALARQFVPIAKTEATCVFPGVGAGTYAVVAMHDENGNGKLDTNFLGIPTEGVGASRDARGRLGPPSFADAAFRTPGGSVEIPIVIRY